jgi:hypothetical protein
LSGEEVIRLLEDQDVGTFLVRFSRYETIAKTMAWRVFYFLHLLGVVNFFSLCAFFRSKPGSFALAFVEPNSAVVLQVEISAAEGGNGGFTVKVCDRTGRRADTAHKEERGARYQRQRKESHLSLSLSLYV